MGCLQGVEKVMKKQFRNFTSTKKFVQKLKFTSISKWNNYCKSGEKPLDIPSSPHKVYKTEWNSWSEFLGNENIASQKRNYLPFIEARNFVRKLKLKKSDEWKEYSKSNKRPMNIPGAPNEVYKNKGWMGIPDWLGNENVSNINREYLTYDQCSKFVQKNNITTRKQWGDFCKSGNKPDNIPGHPWDVYKKQGTWIDWGAFTNTGIVANQNKQYRSYEESKIFVKTMEIKSQKEWQEYCTSGNKPDDIPAAPWNTYKEWKGYGDFLGTGIVANQNIQYRSYKEAREFVRSLGLKGYDDWYAYCKSGNKPDDIPATPWNVYKEWKKK
jgi:hypothetical protein